MLNKKINEINKEINIYKKKIEEIKKEINAIRMSKTMSNTNKENEIKNKNLEIQTCTLKINSLKKKIDNEEKIMLNNYNELIEKIKNISSSKNIEKIKNNISIFLLKIESKNASKIIIQSAGTKDLLEITTSILNSRTFLNIDKKYILQDYLDNIYYYYLIKTLLTIYIYLKHKNKNNSNKNNSNKNNSNKYIEIFLEDEKIKIYNQYLYTIFFLYL